jgi:hypothetical protein
MGSGDYLNEYHFKNEELSKCDNMTIKNKTSQTTEPAIAVDTVLSAGRTQLLNKKFGVVKSGAKVENFSEHFYVMKYTEWTKRDWQFYFETPNELIKRILSVMPNFNFKTDFVVVGS